MKDKVFLKGTEAVAEAAVRAGCRFYAGYPITPQNEIPEYLSRRLPEVGGVFVQGESELASINMVYGAGSSGTRAMTSSSSCGISLMSEGVSFCASARIPIVYCNMARGGPGIGSIQPAQQDYNQATKASGNGGFRMLLGKLLSYATCESSDYNVTFFPSYGAEQRGGTANCYVVISDEPIGAPLGDAMRSLPPGALDTTAALYTAKSSATTAKIGASQTTEFITQLTPT